MKHNDSPTEPWFADGAMVCFQDVDESHFIADAATPADAVFIAESHNAANQARADATAEIERLRAALTRIVDKRMSTGTGYLISVREMRYAEQALSATPQPDSENDDD